VKVLSLFGLREGSFSRLSASSGASIFDSTIPSETLQEESVRYANESRTEDEYKRVMQKGLYMVVYTDKTPPECRYVYFVQDTYKLTAGRNRENTKVLSLSDLIAVIFPRFSKSATFNAINNEKTLQEASSRYAKESKTEEEYRRALESDERFMVVYVDKTPAE
jgi:uncharacterized membrane protein